MPTPKDAILEAAVTVFGSDTRVEDLIAAAKVSRRTFYKYFRGSEDVYAALYEQLTEALVALITPEKGKATLRHVHAGIDAWLDFHGVSGKLLEFLTEQSMRSESQLFPQRQWLREHLVAIIASASRRKKDPLLYWALLSMVEGLSRHLLERGATEGELKRAKRIVHRLADQLLG